MKRIGTKGFTLIVFFIVIAGLGYYTYLHNNTAGNQEVPEKSEKESLLNYDFENDYPKTVRETVKLHCRYLKCAYNNEFSEEELFTVNQQMRKLFDAELIEHNPEDEQLQKLKEEIQLYVDNKRKFISYSLAEASQIQYNTEEGADYAKIKVTIVLKLESAIVSGEEEYILRKDADGKWKILGWQAVNNKEAEDKGDAK